MLSNDFFTWSIKFNNFPGGRHFSKQLDAILKLFQHKTFCPVPYLQFIAMCAIPLEYGGFGSQFAWVIHDQTIRCLNVKMLTLKEKFLRNRIFLEFDILFLWINMYRVTHKGWGFKDDCTEFTLCFFIFMILYSCNKLVYFFAKSFDNLI